MKWIMLIVVAIAGMNAVRTGEPVYDHQIAKACGTDATCIRRHINARRDALGAAWATEPTRYIVWTPDCPPAAEIEFQPCYTPK